MKSYVSVLEFIQDSEDISGTKKRDITCDDVCPYATPRLDFFNVNCKHDHTFL